MSSRSDLAEAAKGYAMKHGKNGHIPYGTSAGELVCNQFVVAVIREALDASFPYVLADDFPGTGYFTKTDTPQKGDLVHWPGHIGIVIEPDQGYFVGSQTSTGVAEANFRHGYWHGQYGGKKPDYFLRWSH